MSKSNVFHIRDCYGCGVCAVSCAHNVIDIRVNNDGFYEPVIINPKSCTNCGICLSVCAFENDKQPLNREIVSSYAAWSKDDEVRLKSSSGGVSFELGKTALVQGLKFCGVRYDAEKNIAEHYIATNEHELQYSIGSKYLQSNTVPGFKSIKRNEKYIVIGTPCQIASFRRYIQKFRCERNFILVDFYCHGVPSKLMWDKYVHERLNNTSTIKNITWRNKSRGWENGYCVTICEDGASTQSYYVDGDAFFTLFIGDACLGKACYDSCVYKQRSSAADIRLGDLWSHYKGDKKGVSIAIAFTASGDELLKRSNIMLIPMEYENAANGQMRTNASRPWYYEKTMKLLKSHKGTVIGLAKFVRRYNFAKRQIEKIKKLLKL